MYDRHFFVSPDANALRLLDKISIGLRLRLFWVKMISGNHFHPFPRVWL